MGKVESEIPAFLTSIRLAQRVTPMVNLPKSTVIPNEVRDLRLLLRKNR